MAKARVAVVFVHGLARKPAPARMEALWLWGLARSDPHPEAFPPPNPEAQGVPAVFTYYADVFYGDDHETDLQDMLESTVSVSAAGADAAPSPSDLHAIYAPTPASAAEAAFLLGVESRMAARLALTAPGRGGMGAADLEIASWLPLIVQQALIKKAAMEAYYYLFDKEFVRADGVRFMPRRELRARFIASVEGALGKADRVVVVGHSMGSMLAYDVLNNVAACPPVDTLITIGSPLGITEVQQRLAGRSGELGFPAARLGRWVNIYDPRDPIAADPVLANDFTPVDGKAVEDIEESNWGSWRHTVTHYLSGPKLRKVLAGATGIAL